MSASRERKKRMVESEQAAPQQADIYQLIDRLAREGMGVIVVSSDLIEIINLSNRIVVMRDGQAIKTLESDELTEENVMLYAMGVNADEKA